MSENQGKYWERLALKFNSRDLAFVETLITTSGTFPNYNENVQQTYTNILPSLCETLSVLEYYNKTITKLHSLYRSPNIGD